MSNTQHLRYDQFQGLSKREGLASQLVDLQLVGEVGHRVQETIELQLHCLVSLLWHHLTCSTGPM